MPSWVLKAFAQRAVGALPAPHFWNELLQRHVSRSLNLTHDKFYNRLDVSRIHLEHFQTYAGPAYGRFNVVELGTGWFPIVPIALWLCGASELRTYDIAQHLTSARLSATLQKFVETFENGTLINHLPAANNARLKFLASLVKDVESAAPEEFLRKIGVEYVIQDFSKNRIPPESIDLIVSYAVLGHPRPDLVAAIFRAFKRNLGPGGVMSHWIDLSDEYAYFDRRITPFNFLRFSPRAWRLIDNDMIPHNRLRLTDFRRLIGEAGFCITEERVVRGNEADLAGVPLAPEFHAHPKDDLLALDAWLVCTSGCSRSDPAC
ncbi:MAG: class I SAM-dependent methyltransferase [Gammaproteobacteria bacterium]